MIRDYERRLCGGALTCRIVVEQRKCRPYRAPGSGRLRRRIRPESLSEILQKSKWASRRGRSTVEAQGPVDGGNACGRRAHAPRSNRGGSKERCDAGVAVIKVPPASPTWPRLPVAVARLSRRRAWLGEMVWQFHRAGRGRGGIVGMQVIACHYGQCSGSRAEETC